MPNRKQRESRYPGTTLEKRVVTDISSCFKAFSKLRAHPTDVETVCEIFGKGFASQLSRYGNGERYDTADGLPKFLNRLIGIFNLRAEEAGVVNPESDHWIRFCRWLPNYSQRGAIQARLDLLKKRFTSAWLFPGYVGQLITLVKSTQTCALLIFDGVDHASFRDIAKHRILVAAMCRKARLFKANPEKQVQFLITVFKESMSWANKYRWLHIRNANKAEFLRLLENFLQNVKRHRRHFPKEFDRVWNDFYKNHALYESEEGEIKRLYRLQRKYHDYILKILMKAGVEVRIDQEAKRLDDTGTESEHRTFPKFLCVRDDVEAISVDTRPDDDAVAKMAESEFEAKDRANTFREQFRHAKPIRPSDLRKRSLRAHAKSSVAIVTKATRRNIEGRSYRKRPQPGVL